MYWKTQITNCQRGSFLRCIRLSSIGGLSRTKCTGANNVSQSMPIRMSKLTGLPTCSEWGRSQPAHHRVCGQPLSAQKRETVWRLAGVGFRPELLGRQGTSGAYYQTWRCLFANLAHSRGQVDGHECGQKIWPYQPIGITARGPSRLVKGHGGSDGQERTHSVVRHDSSLGLCPQPRSHLGSCRVA